MNILLSTPDIVISDDLDFLVQSQRIANDAMLLVFCRAGSLRIELDRRHYELHVNELLFCMPSFLLGNFRHTVDFECYIFAFTSDSLRDVVYSCLRYEPHWFENIACLKRHPIVQLSAHRMSMCYAYGQLFRQYAKESSARARRISGLLAQAAIFEMMSWVEETVQQKNTTPCADNRDVSTHVNELFGQFLQLLEEHRAQRHTVSWYADKMAISAKYLTYVCTTVARQTPSAFINDITIREIKSRLRNTNDSVKEIAIDMQFATASR